MNFIEAMNALLEGKKIRVPGWRKDAFVYINNERRFVDEDGEYAMIVLDDHGKYELYEEPREYLTFADALRQLFLGKKIRNLSWPKERMSFSVPIYDDGSIFISSIYADKEAVESNLWYVIEE